jgi:hypothetical protein
LFVDCPSFVDGQSDKVEINSLSEFRARGQQLRAKAMKRQSIASSRRSSSFLKSNGEPVAVVASSGSGEGKEKERRRRADSGKDLDNEVAAGEWVRDALSLYTGGRVVVGLPRTKQEGAAP